MFPVSALPRCVALVSKHGDSSRYLLRSVHDESHGGSLVELVDGSDGNGGVMDPRCRFYLEPSKEHEGLMHVRCCYNNKYWVPQQRVLPGGDGCDDPRWVVGTADELEEDLSKPSCTLFKHIPAIIAADGDEETEAGYTCRFQHSRSGKYVFVSPNGSITSIRPYLHVAHDEGGQDDGVIDSFTVIDVSEQKHLPLYLAFKGDNECFLGGRVIEGYNYLQFSERDIGDPRVMNTIFTNDDGVVRIKSDYFGLFWRRSPNWIYADSDDTTHNNHNTLFRVVVIGDDGLIALQNLGNNNFCKRLTTEGKTNCLNAAVHSITANARLWCYETVVSRDIYDVDFDLIEARKYTKGIDSLNRQTVINRTSTTNTTTLTFTYTSTVETRWSSTVSMKRATKINLQSGIPFLVGRAEIEISAEYNGSYTWGQTKIEQIQTNKQITINVPPMKKVTVKAIGLNSVCDVPFSYTQRDILTNGQEVIQKFKDGMYFGVKTSDIMFDVTEEDLTGVRGEDYTIFMY